MVVLNKIYTKTGDDGTTALATGERLRKDDLRVECYGTVDEANSCIGMARAQAGGSFPELEAMLLRLQNDFFDLGGELASPGDRETLGYEPLRVLDSQTKRIEADIDVLTRRLTPLRTFVLPGGHPAAAALHLARTVSRRAERLMVSLSRTEGETVRPEAMRFINRASDFLFVAARIVNGEGRDDVLWVPGANR